MITIVDDDEPGVLSFSEDDFYVSQANKACATVWVRPRGSSGPLESMIPAGAAKQSPSAGRL